MLAAGPRAQLDTERFELGVEPEFAQFGILLEFLDGQNRLCGVFGLQPLRATGTVVQSRKLLVDPAPQDVVNGGPAHLQVRGNARLIPALEMELQHRPPTGKGVGNAAI